MSENEKYQDKLNIPTLSIGTIKNLIKKELKYTIDAWDKGLDVDKQCFHIIGPAGVGKTEIMKQITTELTEELFPNGEEVFEMIMIKAPVLSRDDFIIPFPTKDEKTGNMSFEMLQSDFVPKDKDSCGIFVIDELSRGDHSLQQLLWQVMNEGSIHTHHFPKKFFVVSIDNPDDQEYSMDTMDDAAGLRRMLHLYVDVDITEFLKYAIKQDFHPFVVEYLQNNPDHLYDFEAQKIGRVFANPASWEKVSDHLMKYELQEPLKNNLDMIEILASGLLNNSEARLFVDFIKNKKTVDPKDVFFKYKKIKKDVMTLVKSKDNAALGELMNGFVTYLSTSQPKYKTIEKNNVIAFLCDMPIDTAAVFVSAIDGFKRDSTEFDYFLMLHITLMKNEVYKANFNDIVLAIDKEK